MSTQGFRQWQQHPAQSSSRPLPTPVPSGVVPQKQASAGLPARRSSPVKFIAPEENLSQAPSTGFVPYWKRNLPASPTKTPDLSSVHRGNTSPVRFGDVSPVRESPHPSVKPGEIFPSEALNGASVSPSRSSTSPERRPLPAAPTVASSSNALQQQRPLSAFQQRASVFTPRPTGLPTSPASYNLHRSQTVPPPRTIPSPSPPLEDDSSEDYDDDFAGNHHSSPQYGIRDLPNRSPQYGIRDLPKTNHFASNSPAPNDSPRPSTMSHPRTFSKSDTHPPTPVPSHQASWRTSTIPTALQPSSRSTSTFGGSIPSSTPIRGQPFTSEYGNSVNSTNFDSSGQSLTFRIAALGLADGSSSSTLLNSGNPRPEPKPRPVSAFSGIQANGKPWPVDLPRLPRTPNQQHSPSILNSSPSPPKPPAQPYQPSTALPNPPTPARPDAFQSPGPAFSQASSSAMSRSNTYQAHRFTQQSSNDDLLMYVQRTPTVQGQAHPAALLQRYQTTPPVNHAAIPHTFGSSQRQQASPQPSYARPHSYHQPLPQRQPSLPSQPSARPMSYHPSISQSLPQAHAEHYSLPAQATLPLQRQATQATHTQHSHTIQQANRWPSQSSPRSESPLSFHSQQMQQAQSQPVMYAQTNNQPQPGFSSTHPPRQQIPPNLRQRPPTILPQPPPAVPFQSTSSSRQPSPSRSWHQHSNSWSPSSSAHPPNPSQPLPPSSTNQSRPQPQPPKPAQIQSPSPQVPPVIAISVDEEVTSDIPAINVSDDEDDFGPMISISGPDVVSDGERQPSVRSRPLRPPITHSSNPLTCGGCSKLIAFGRAVNAMGVRWHPDCFRCCKCDTLLEHISSYEGEGRAWCHLDYHENFAPRCYHCKTAIVEERFISLDDPALGKRTYHEQHFFCAECGDPFLDPSSSRTGELNVSGDGSFADDDVGFTVYQGHPYCEACHVRLRMPKCKKCKKSIRENMQAVEALGGKWCYECFVCKSCQRPFEDPAFFERNGEPYCENCFSVILRNEI